MMRGPTTAMVLAAGLGKRMRPLAGATPKPLVKVAGKALIDHALDRFAAAGVERAVVNVHYRADEIEGHLAPRRTPKIVVSDERDELLETGGGLKKAAPLLGAGPVFCTNTDAILLDEEGEACARLAAAFDAERMDALLLLARKERSSGLDGPGDFDLGHDGRIAFRSGETAARFYTGLMIISLALLAGAHEGPFSMRLLWTRAAQAKRLFGLDHRGFWMHVGDPEGFRAAEARLGAGGPEAER
ncbi:MAG: nucleotidyltransferase family protein [Parvularculaceae bacterium]|nr:nucleotidyltransferase family protein [Parvularculaceae bacterium]